MRPPAIVFAAAALFALVGSASASPSAPGQTVFDVTRNGQPFGRHSIIVSGAGDDLRADITVSLRAGLGPITAFRLEQSCTETWRAGVLAGLTCSTLKDGRRTRVTAEVRNNQLRVSGADGENWFPLGAAPTSWCTQPPISATALIDTETGEPMRVRVTHMGRETIEAGGERIQADRIRVVGTLAVDLWYDSNGRWVGCAFTARGQRVEYRLASPRDAAPA